MVISTTHTLAPAYLARGYAEIQTEFFSNIGAILLLRFAKLGDWTLTVWRMRLK